MNSILELYFKTEKRKRITIPKTILYAGLFLLFYPVINFLGIAYYYKSISFPFLFKHISIIQFCLIIFPSVIGVGLIKVKKWAWYSFLGYAFILLMFNIYGVYKNPVLFNYISIIEVIFVFFLITYFSRKDISAPYFKLYPRGWRGEIRKPIQIKLLINGVSKTTRDISEAGFYVDWLNSNLKLNSEVSAEIRTGANKRILRAGVVRINDNGVGFAFRQLSKEDRKWIEVEILSS